VSRFTNFLEGVIRESLKNPRKIDQISGKKYMDLFYEKNEKLRLDETCKQARG
jgi:hypothetical protein